MANSESYNIQVTKAENGWIVSVRGSSPGEMAQQTFVVPEGEDMAKFIAAAITAGRLETTGAIDQRLVMNKQSDLYEQMRRNMYYQPYVSTADSAMASTSGALTGAAMNQVGSSLTSNDANKLASGLLSKIWKAL